MKNKSIWEELDNNFKMQSIDKDLDIDVLIVGGGITGISVLHQLMLNKVCFDR